MPLSELYVRARELWREEGLVEFIRGLCRFLYWHTGLRELNHKIRYFIAENHITVRVGSVEREFVVNSYTDFVRYYTLMNERDILKDFISELDQEDRFVDVGANVGVYSVYAGSQFKDRRIDSIEPHPTNIHAMERNFHHNETEAEIHECALANKQGEFVLEPSGKDPGEGEHALVTSESESGIIVNVDTMDNLVAEGHINKPSVVKIDVEGAELDVVKGGQETLSDGSCRLVYCEVHFDRLEEYGGSYQELRKTLVEYGFEIEVISGTEGGYCTLKATKTDKEENVRA